MSRPIVLITGASGHIGGWLTETLCLTGRVDVRPGIRKWSSGARLGRLPVEVVLCDVLDREQIIRALHGVDHVVHCAADGIEVIVRGTENMLDLSLRAGVTRFVHLSTTEVYGDCSGVVYETEPYRKTGSPYGDSKVKAEQLCWRYYRRGLPVSMLRPSIVYGPFGRAWTVDMAHKLGSGNWGAFKGCGDGICNLVYVADLVSAILLVLNSKRAIGEAFNIVGPETVTWNEYFQRFADAMGLGILPAMDPTGCKIRSSFVGPAKVLAKSILGLLGDPIQALYDQSSEARAAMRWLERKIRTTPTLKDLALYDRRARYATTKAREMLDYTPQVDVESGLRISVKWLEHQGLLL